MSQRTAPIPYQPVGRKQSAFVGLRLDEALVDGIAELLPALRPLGYKSESDLIRTAIFEFIQSYAHLAENPDRLSRLALVTHAYRQRIQALDLEQLFITATVQHITTLVQDDLWEEAGEVLREAELHLSQLPDKRLVKSLGRKLDRHPVVSQLRDRQAHHATLAPARQLGQNG
jgi:Arc/MetJ-type ribon-helix-helix transcriptional regulator